MTHPIPDAALANHIAILGKTGSGKTYAAKGAVESLLSTGGRVCVIDPTGAWHGLRSSATGKSAGFPVAIFGGAHADLPLGGAHGEAMAEIIGTSSTPAILDTSLMRVSERTRFFADFADALVRKNKGPLHFIVDEAHLFAPQGKVSDPQSGAMLHAANNLVSLGRSRGLRIILITQRPAKLHKDSLTQVETLVALRLIAPQDRAAVESWIKDNADEKQGREIIASLATLKTGHGWIWAPELGILERVAFPRIKTFDSSRAPEDDSDGNGPVLAPIDRAAIEKRLQAVAADAVANDPKALRAEIAKLRKQVTSRAPVPVDTTEIERRAHERGKREAIEWQRRVHKQVQIAAQLAASGSDAMTRVLAALDMPAPAEVPAPSRPASRWTPPARAANGHAKPASGITRPQQRILDAILWLETVGVTPASKEAVAFLAEASSTSGGYFNNLGTLRTAGLIEYPQGGFLALTEAGRASANQPESAGTLANLHDAVRRKLQPALRKVLDVAIEVYPESLSKDDMAARAGVSATSGGYFNNLSRLRTLGLIDYPSKGTVQATRVLFPEGLA